MSRTSNTKLYECWLWVRIYSCWFRKQKRSSKTGYLYLPANGSIHSLLAVFPPTHWTFSMWDLCHPCWTNQETDENQKTKTCLVFNSLPSVDCLKPACVTVVDTNLLLCSSENCASPPFLACITTNLQCLPRWGRTCRGTRFSTTLPPSNTSAAQVNSSNCVDNFSGQVLFKSSFKKALK